MVQRRLLGRFEPIHDLCLFPAGMLALRPRDGSGRSGGVFAEGNFRSWRGRMGQVQCCGCGRGTHGGGLPFSELQDVVQILKAGAVGASCEAQGLCVCLARPASAEEICPARGLRSRSTFALFSGCSRVFRAHHSWPLQGMKRKNLQRSPIEI
jgi:hypothetical protein